MPLEVTDYVDPGVYLGEVIVPGAVNIATTPSLLGIVGVGSRLKQVTNEAVQRGLVEGQALTFLAPSGTGDAITAPSSGNQTLTDAGAAFTTQIIGSTITIRNATNAANNGTFLIVDRPSGTSVVYSNPGGVVEGSFTGTWTVKPTAVVGGLSTPVRTNRALQNTTVFRDGRAVSDAFLNFRKAHIETALAGPFAIIGVTQSKAAVRVATENETDTWTPAGAGVGKTLTSPNNLVANNTFNGVTTIVGQRVLVKDFGGGASNLNNGIYVLTQAANGAVPAILTRATDYDQAVEFTQFDGIYTLEGTTSAGVTYVLTTAGPYTVDTTALQFDIGNDTIVVEEDGKVPLTLILTAQAGATTVLGTQVTVKASKIAVLATATLAEVIAAVNEGLSPTDGTANTAVTALGYGAAYAASTRIITGTGLRIASPTTGPSSDVRVSVPRTRSGVVTIFGAAAALNRDAPSVIELERVAYGSSSVYTIDYVNINDTADALQNTSIDSILRIGTSPGIGNFEDGIDFSLTSDQVDWSLGAAAAFLSTIAGPFNLSVNDTVRLGVDGRSALDFDLNALASPPLGYASPTTPASATPAEVVNNINAILAASSAYGSRFQSFASTLTDGSLTYVRLASPTIGSSSSITISTPTTAPTNDATLAIFGLQSTQLPSTSVGTGDEPSAAEMYFVTYVITRAAADYNVQKRFFSESQAAADLGEANSNNPLMVAAKVAFRQGVSSVVAIQVDDDSLPGSPTRQEFLDGLNSTINSDLITEVAVLSTDLATQIDLKDHIESESAPTHKHYRRGWFGMSLNTDPGDKDTPDSFVYRANRTLQVAPESPGRGRMILVAPPQRQGVSLDLTLNDGSIERMQLDSTYLAVAAAAKHASFTSPALSLARQTVGGFNTDDIDLGSIWRPEERKLMAKFGTMVVTYDAGNFKILDPCTTEQGAGGLKAFSYPSTSAQKDNISRKVDKALDANIVGIVPTDLSDFIIDIKSFIGDVLMGEIGSRAIAPYRNADRTTRRIDLTKDIEVEQDENDPTQFFFKYFFNLRYPALRLFGEFSVDNAFFSTAVAA